MPKSFRPVESQARGGLVRGKHADLARVTLPVLTSLGTPESQRERHVRLGRRTLGGLLIFLSALKSQRAQYRVELCDRECVTRETVCPSGIESRCIVYAAVRGGRPYVVPPPASKVVTVPPPASPGHWRGLTTLMQVPMPAAHACRGPWAC